MKFTCVMALLISSFYLSQPTNSEITNGDIITVIKEIKQDVEKIKNELTGVKQYIKRQLDTRAKELDGGGWTLVRHVPAGCVWHKATDQLRGTDVYGVPCGALCEQAWSIKFDNVSFNQFLFTTGDVAKWLIASKGEVTGGYYTTANLRLIYKSSTSASSYKARWYRRRGYLEDPWVSLIDHSAAINQGDIIYGENNVGDVHATRILPLHKGANVFIRTIRAKELDGGGWTLVRHVPAGDVWHKATDQLRGTDVYGVPCGALCEQAWSIKFDHINFNQFLFTTGDVAKWLIASKGEVTGGYYTTANLRLIYKSSTSASSYKARWYRRLGYLEDPWVSLIDHGAAINQGDIIYGENNAGGVHATRILPLHRGANVFIRTHADTILSASSIQHDTLIRILPRVSKVYSVKFEVFPTEFKRGFHNVIHFTTGGDAKTYGDRIPGVWFHESGRGNLQVASAVNGERSFVYTSPSSLPTMQWTKIDISQSQIGEEYFYRIGINGKEVVNVKNSKPQVFEDVKVFVSDKWYDSQRGYIRNLCVM